MLIFVNRYSPSSVISGSVSTSALLNNHHRPRISRRRRHHYLHLQSQNVSRIETCGLYLKLLKIQTSPVFTLRFPRLANAPERNRTLGRSRQLRRRLSSLFRTLRKNHNDDDILLKSFNRPHSTEWSSICIRAFVEHADKFLVKCERRCDC